MGFRDRLRRLEHKTNAVPDQCPECNDLIIYQTIAEDGTITYPHGEPCSSCDSRGAGGRIGRIIVDMRGPEDKTEVEPGVHATRVLVGEESYP